MKSFLTLATRIVAFFVPKKFGRFVTYEMVSYLFFGVLTTLVSLGFFALFFYSAGMGGALAGAVSNILSIFFAFFTNKLWVFESPSWSRKIFWPEFLKFCASRALTFVIDIFVLMLLVDNLGFDAMIVRILTMVVIHVIGNYVLSKWLVFTKKEAQKEAEGG